MGWWGSTGGPTWTHGHELLSWHIVYSWDTFPTGTCSCTLTLLWSATVVSCHAVALCSLWVRCQGPLGLAALLSRWGRRRSCMTSTLCFRSLIPPGRLLTVLHCCLASVDTGTTFSISPTPTVATVIPTPAQSITVRRGFSGAVPYVEGLDVTPGCFRSGLSTPDLYITTLHVCNAHPPGGQPAVLHHCPSRVGVHST